MTIAEMFTAEKQATDAMMADPRVGDRFTEMYAFWMYVVARDGERVVTMQANPPCTLPDDGTLREFATVDDFKAAYAYGNKPDAGYWIREAGWVHNVEGWAQR